MNLKVLFVAVLLSLVFIWSCQKESKLTPDASGNSAKDTEQFTANSTDGSITGAELIALLEENKAEILSTMEVISKALAGLMDDSTFTTAVGDAVQHTQEEDYYVKLTNLKNDIPGLGTKLVESLLLHGGSAAEAQLLADNWEVMQFGNLKVYPDIFVPHYDDNMFNFPNWDGHTPSYVQHTHLGTDTMLTKYTVSGSSIVTEQIDYGTVENTPNWNVGIRLNVLYPNTYNNNDFEYFSNFENRPNGGCHCVEWIDSDQIRQYTCQSIPGSIGCGGRHTRKCEGHSGECGPSGSPYQEDFIWVEGL